MAIKRHPLPSGSNGRASRGPQPEVDLPVRVCNSPAHDGYHHVLFTRGGGVDRHTLGVARGGVAGVVTTVRGAGRPVPGVGAWAWAFSGAALTLAAGQKSPCCGAHSKYRTPCTAPSFFPSASSSSMPTHSPAANCVAPTKRTVPRLFSLVTTLCPTATRPPASRAAADTTPTGSERANRPGCHGDLPLHIPEAGDRSASEAVTVRRTDRLQHAMPW
jgi:hypothetical protein